MLGALAEKVSDKDVNEAMEEVDVNKDNKV